MRERSLAAGWSHEVGFPEQLPTSVGEAANPGPVQTRQARRLERLRSTQVATQEDNSGIEDERVIWSSGATASSSFPGIPREDVWGPVSSVGSDKISKSRLLGSRSWHQPCMTVKKHSRCQIHHELPFCKPHSDQWTKSMFATSFGKGLP